MEGGATVDPLQEDVAVQIKKGITEPSGSSSPDNLSMKSDKSMELPLNYKEGTPLQCVSEESSDSASDVVKRDQTRDVPEHQGDHQPTDQRVYVEEPPTPSYLSMKSDRSMNLPMGFRRSDQTHKEEVDLDRSESPTTSICLSEESDAFMEPPIDFKSGRCDLCSDAGIMKRAVKTCQNCSSSYCETHVRKHYTEARYQTHHLVDVPRGLEQRLCQDHHRPLELFCRTDHMLICSLCSGTKHRGHDIHHQTEITGGKLTTFDGKTRKRLTSVNVLPPPGEISFLSVKSDSVTLRWKPPEGLEGAKKFKVTWEGDGLQKSLKVTDASQVVITGLQPGQQYEFSVTTEGEHGNQSKSVSAYKHTVVPPPRDIKVVRLGATSLVLRWSKAEGMEHLPQDFMISYHSPGTETLTIYTEDCSRTLTDLQPGTKYTVSVSTVLKNGEQSEPVSTTIWTILMQSVLDNLGLGCHLENKLTIEGVRQIGGDAVTERTVTDLPSQLELFLKRLLMMNMKARNLKGNRDRIQHSSSLNTPSSDDQEMEARSKDINPLDLITALFLCSDGPLQQELSLKMSLCQFAVPLLLPNSDTQQITLMLWAMRDIVKQFRSQSSDDKNEFVEKSIVLTELPVVSFVRLGDSGLSKSKFLNEVLSNSQQINSTFVHHDMAGGNTPRQISDGLVEISWYLPGSNPETNVFAEPVTVANLRGDLQSYQTQFSFLCQTSAAVFVFCDDLDFDVSILNMKAQLFIVCNFQSKIHDEATFKKRDAEIQKHNGRMIKKSQSMNDADLVKELQSAVRDVLKAKPLRMELEGMAGVARKLHIAVDEDHGPCQTAKATAAMITNVSDILKYKEKQLPLQGQTWRDLTALEKEERKLKEKGDKTIEEYKSELEEEKRKLREKQKTYGMSDSIKGFIKGLTCSEEERSYFLRWMKINLDNLSRTELSKLRKEYRDTFQKSPMDRNHLAKLDEQIVNSSLGTEHFLREVGQLYEVSMLFAEDLGLRQEIQELPRICAELMLSGFPLELMDGDASNIPIKWITDVLEELDSLTKPNNRIRVVTVLGPQSSGKSTLLNTMFAVHFAVSSGRCTRGAFMQLIKVKDEFRDVSNCDFIMVIDTEGLRALQSSHATYNCEHDNELATLVVGLSDISIVNIAMENNSDMKDILQIVTHAFLRMKESGKKPNCLFVHQNVTDVAASDKTLREQTLLLEQLNEMTKAASKMEHIGECEFTDIIIYKPEENCNIPGLWHGSPPMAPVNEGYCEAVVKLKMHLSKAFENLLVAAETFQEFSRWLQLLWTAIKHENFIFSFRNSIVARAYDQLCVEYNKWEGDFQKHMYNWLLCAETTVANYGLNSCQEISGLDAVLQQLKHEAKDESEREGKVFLDKVTEYYKGGKCNVHLLERYKEEFKVSAQNQKRATDSHVMRKLEVAADVRRCTFGVDNIKRNNRDIMNKKVSDLVKKCKSNDKPMNDEEREEEFVKMWDKTVGELSFGGLDHQDVAKSIYYDLQTNLEREAPQISEMLSEPSISQNWGNEEFQVKKDYNTVVRFIQKNVAMYEDQKMTRKTTQEVANDIIAKSRTFIATMVKNKKDYHRTHTMELLELIKNNLDQHSDLHISAYNAAALKIHICGHAAREFQKMHETFIKDNDPWQHLDKLKPQYLVDFKNLYTQKDQCSRKAEDFTNRCLKPAVEEYIRGRLGKDILEEVQSKSHDFKTRRSFQFSMLKNLVSSDFSTFQRYIDKYNEFSQEFILNALVTNFSTGHGSIANMEVKHLEEICGKIRTAVSEKSQISAGDQRDLKFTQFIQDLRSELSSVLVIPDDTTGLILEDSKTKEFSDMLTISVKDMEKHFKDQFHQDGDVLGKLTNLPDPPQDELHRRLLGCGIKCLFCNTSCESGGETHEKHSASLHRPAGLGGYTWPSSNELVKETCTDHIKERNVFIQCFFHMAVFFKHDNGHKKWDIRPHNTTASNYWKFLFVKHNEEYAKSHSALPANIPEDWKTITSEQALKSLTGTYPKENCIVS